jgi:hypothetical protein
VIDHAANRDLVQAFASPLQTELLHSQSIGWVIGAIPGAISLSSRLFVRDHNMDGKAGDDLRRLAWLVANWSEHVVSIAIHDEPAVPKDLVARSTSLFLYDARRWLLRSIPSADRITEVSVPRDSADLVADHVVLNRWSRTPLVESNLKTAGSTSDLTPTKEQAN